jgi:hypothetical protein
MNKVINIYSLELLVLDFERTDKNTMILSVVC